MHNLRAAIRVVGPLVIGIASCAAQGLAENELSAKLEGAISPSGILEATLTVIATGAPSSPYRGALLKNSGVASPLLFGGFARSRQLQSTPQVLGADTAAAPVEVRVRVHEEEFLLPIRRQQSLPLDLIPMALPVTSAPTGAIRPGSPSRYAEEIALVLPDGFTVNGMKSVKEERAFARFRKGAPATDRK